MSEQTEKKRFEPKQPVQLDPPKDDPITMEELSKCDGMDLSLYSRVDIVLSTKIAVPASIRLAVLKRAVYSPSVWHCQLTRFFFDR